MPFVDDSLDAERDLGRAEGRREERERLRPLLERALEFATAQDRVHSFAVTSQPGELLTDLRRELGEKKP